MHIHVAHKQYLDYPKVGAVPKFVEYASSHRAPKQEPMTPEEIAEHQELREVINVR